MAPTKIRAIAQHENAIPITTAEKNHASNGVAFLAVTYTFFRFNFIEKPSGGSGATRRLAERSTY